VRYPSCLYGKKVVVEKEQVVRFMANIPKQLFTKYNVPAPRYTSYPTVPFWEEHTFSTIGWEEAVKNSLESQNTPKISLYIHLPYCESLCTFCGCNKRITKNHAVEVPYINTLLKEWDLYTRNFVNAPVIEEIHLGGGTPTFFKSENLKLLMDGIKAKCSFSENIEMSFEGNPNSTTTDHLQELYNIGFRRVSFGIQDFDPKVQVAINRVQTYMTVETVTHQAREIGYESVNFDLVYGLPFQTIESIVDTVEKTNALNPDRIAFYSYAHVPWVKGLGQRKFSEADLPDPDYKREMYEKGRELFESSGYLEIGMDHFSRKEDDLFLAWKEKRLHRNFMGYTTRKSSLMIGLGVSSISDSWNFFAQNEKVVEDYMNRVNNNEIPVFRGHKLSPTDLYLREKILEVMCFGSTRLEKGNYDELNSQIIRRLEILQKDDLVNIEKDRITITAIGQTFLRNVCMAFDQRLWDNNTKEKFSMAV